MINKYFFNVFAKIRCATIFLYVGFVHRGCVILYLELNHFIIVEHNI